MMGGTFPGSPFIHVGFNENLGWGATVNQPDLGDIYELSLNPENNDEYLLDGEWKSLRKIKQNFKIKLPWELKYLEVSSTEEKIRLLDNIRNNVKKNY